MPERFFDGGGGPSVSTHRLFFLLCAGALTAAVGLAWLEFLWPRFAVAELPIACALRRTTGYPCPGCGLTRSWVALGRGDLAASLAYHRLGWVVMLYVALQAVRHGLWMLAPSIRSIVDRCGHWLDWSLAPLALAMFANWGWMWFGS